MRLQDLLAAPTIVRVTLMYLGMVRAPRPAPVAHVRVAGDAVR